MLPSFVIGFREGVKEWGAPLTGKRACDTVDLAAKEGGALVVEKDPRRQFVPIQRSLGSSDLLNEYIRHTGSGLFAVPPGMSGPGDWFGKALFS